MTVDGGGDAAAEIRGVWQGKLRPVAPELLHPELPPPLRDLLVEVGLPVENFGDVVFHGFPLQETMHVEGRDFVGLGNDHGAPIVIDPVEGSVWKMIPGWQPWVQFYNSTLHAYLYTLGRLDAAFDVDQILDAGPAQSRRLLDEMRDEFTALDPPSMQGPHARWPDYLDHLQYFDTSPEWAITSLWRKKLHPLPPQTLHPGLPVRVRDFLTEVGAPTGNYWNAVFHDVPQETLHLHGRHFVVIGHRPRHGHRIVIDTATEAVWTVTPGAPGSLRFVNSTLPVFLSAFALMDAITGRVTAAPPSVSRLLIAKLRHEFTRLDLPSMRHVHAEWPTHLGEMDQLNAERDEPSPTRHARYLDEMDVFEYGRDHLDRAEADREAAIVEWRQAGGEHLSEMLSWLAEGWPGRYRTPEQRPIDSD